MKRGMLLLLLVGCGRPHASPNALPAIPFTVGALQADSIAAQMVQRAFDADARLINPDSLYLADAEIVVNGTARADAPRFAGVAAGGSIQPGSSRFAVTGSFVWGTIQYRWVPNAPGKRMVDGWATVMIGRLKTGEWRILHVHSSTAGASGADST